VHTAGIDSFAQAESDRLDTRRLVKKLAVQRCRPTTRGLVSAASDPGLTLLARQRCGLARLRAQTKNRVHSLLEMHGLRPERCVFTKLGREWIGSKRSRRGSVVLRAVLSPVRFSHRRAETSEAELEEAAVAFPQVALLRTIPGLGHVLAAVVWSEIGDLTRFDSADALLNYTGLVPSSYDSGEVSIHGPTPAGAGLAALGVDHPPPTPSPQQESVGTTLLHLRRCHKHPNVARRRWRFVARCIYGV